MEKCRFRISFGRCGTFRKSRATRCQNSSLLRRLATPKTWKTRFRAIDFFWSPKSVFHRFFWILENQFPAMGWSGPGVDEKNSDEKLFDRKFFRPKIFRPKKFSVEKIFGRNFFRPKNSPSVSPKAETMGGVRAGRRPHPGPSEKIGKYLARKVWEYAIRCCNFHQGC